MSYIGGLISLWLGFSVIGLYDTMKSLHEKYAAANQKKADAKWPDHKLLIKRLKKERPEFRESKQAVFEYTPTGARLTSSEVEALQKLKKNPYDGGPYVSKYRMVRLA